MAGVTGTTLARDYYRDVVHPLLQARWPGLPHAAGRLGSGSDVLGLDDEMSRDHDWGLRLALLVDAEHVRKVDEYLAGSLPQSYRGLPARFSTSWDTSTRHRVEVDTAEGFAMSRLGLDVTHAWDAVDWLSLTGQALLEVTAGEVFTDTRGAATDIRRRLAWYPRDVWLYVLASAWGRIGQELPSVGRSGSRGDDLGSRVIAARIARAAMHLGFLLERRWWPYAKWMGTAFAALPRAGGAHPHLRAAVSAEGWQAQEDELSAALGILHDVQRSLGLPTGDRAVEPFWDRPFHGIADDVAQRLLDAVTDPMVRGLPRGAGSIEQWVDNVDVLTDAALRACAVRSWRDAGPADRDG